MLDQHRLRPTFQQAASHAHAILQGLRPAITETVQFQLVRAQHISGGQRFFEQKAADFGRYDAALFRMPHDRVTQVQGLGVGRLDPRHATEDRAPLLGAAHVAGQHRIAIAQLADRGNALDQCGNLSWRKHFSRPLAILSVIGELHGIECPDIHTDPLHREHCRAITGMAENYMGLDGEQMRRTFHARLPKQ
ncbi:hypothetical protein D3C76_996360 [compost metagenome]